MPKLKRTMFREYDIRGRVDKEELNEDNIQFIGKGFGTFLKQYDIQETVIGFDAREYSKRVKDAFVKGVISTGVDIKEIGQTITPIVYFAQYYLKIKGVAMITASHNPNGWTGFKLGHGFGVTFLPENIKTLYQIIKGENFVQAQGKNKIEPNILDIYTDFILKRVNLKKSLKVVVNAGNGTAGPIVPSILRKAGCQVIEQFCDIDFAFPHHEPNPAALEALEALGSKVREVKADIGLGYDGDGDRLGVVDEKGEVIWPDRFMILLARQVLKENPNAKIIFDVKSSQALAEEIEKYGGIPIMWKTGHSYIKQKAKEVGASLAGERSGHIFYCHGYYGYDDAVFSSLKLLEYLSAETKSLSKIMLTTPQYIISPAWNVFCPDEVKYEIVNKLVREFKAEYGSERVIDINGARVKFDDGWGLVRASSNLPALVLVFEAKTKKGMEIIENIFRQKLVKYPEIGNEWKSG